MFECISSDPVIAAKVLALVRDKETAWLASCAAREAVRVGHGKVDHIYLTMLSINELLGGNGVRVYRITYGINLMVVDRGNEFRSTMVAFGNQFSAMTFAEVREKYAILFADESKHDTVRH